MKRHLAAEQIVDLVEGARSESAESHLQSCADCRARVEELRAAMAMAADVNVPEPSPLFWDHFSARVRDAVAAEGAPRPGFLGSLGIMPWWVTAMAGAVAAVLIAVGVTMYRPAVPVAGPGAATVAAADALSTGAPGNDDATLSMMADLAASADMDAMREGGLAALTTHVGGADDAMGVLTDGERVELQRLLKEALAKPGA